ncbi:hypothetical protein [Streptomyces sp. NPDC007355]|uniref:hypothetical protein n=1 Tax=Streptomyces sp. NPDC007355 TaxID=3364778 RepID=UPI0036D1904A
MGAAWIAVVTSEAGVLWDTDLRLIVKALRDSGVMAEAVPWGAEAVAWDRFDLAVIRSAWNYAERIGEFLAWADKTARLTRLRNPVSVVRWSSDKRYLLDLAEQGVAVVPTRFIEPGGRPERLPRGRRGGGQARGIRGCGGHRTLRARPACRCRAACPDAVGPGPRRDGPALSASAGRRERALVFVSGTFSHAIRKGPVLTEPGVIGNNRVSHPDVPP